MSLGHPGDCWPLDDDKPTGEAVLAASHDCAALIERIKSARTLSHDCWRTYVEKGLVNQRHYASGQLDAFDAVLTWIDLAQHNARTEPRRKGDDE